jgi:hypothetical protein
VRVILPYLCVFILFFNCSFYAQQAEQIWKFKYEKGAFQALEKELDLIIQTNHPEKHDALKLFGDLYKVRGDVETAYFYWKKSDAILRRIDPGLNSRAIELAHLSNFYFEKLNPELTKLYNDSLIYIVSKLDSLAIQEHWIWNVIAQSNKLPLDKKNGEILFHKYEQDVFPYYEKNILNYKKNKAFSFQLARTYHLYANAHVDLVHAFNSDLTNRDKLMRLENKANLLYNKALVIYTNMFGTDHYEIARIRYVQALLYQYAHPKPDPNEFHKTIELFESALSVFNISEAKVLNISEALGCAKQYHRALYQEYRLTSNLKLKSKQDSIFNLSKKLWEGGLHLFKTKNPNQLISLYGLSPYTERFYQIYFEYRELAISDINDVFNCMQKLKYQDKKHSNDTRKSVIQSIEGIQKKLCQRQCYLEYSVTPKPFVLFISKDKFELIELETTKGDVNQFLESIINRDFYNYVETSFNLRKSLLKNIELSNFDKIFIISQSWFSHVPFQALLMSNKNIEKKDYRKLDYLLKQVDIEYLFNASDLKIISSIRPWNLEIFVPTYSDGLALPFAKRFTEKFKFNFRLFNDKKAISSSFNNSTSTILHFSGHGIGSNFKREAAIIKFSNGSLGVEKIYSSKIKPNLVVLNSCSSGKGVYNEGDGIDGFPRAFYMKGAQQILSTFWNLDDRASHHIMERFYQYLAMGVESNTALRESQIKYISIAKNSDMAAPYYWGGHQFYGPSQSFEIQLIEKQKKWSLFWLIIPLSIVLICYISIKIRDARL